MHTIVVTLHMKLNFFICIFEVYLYLKYICANVFS